MDFFFFFKLTITSFGTWGLLSCFQKKKKKQCDNYVRFKTKINSLLTWKAKCEPVRHLRWKCNCLVSQGARDGNMINGPEENRNATTSTNSCLIGKTKELIARRFHHTLCSVSKCWIVNCASHVIQEHFKKPPEKRWGRDCLGREDMESSVSCYKQLISDEAALLVI